MSDNPMPRPNRSNASRMDSLIRSALTAVHEAADFAERIGVGCDSTYLDQLDEAYRKLEEARKNAIDTLEG